MEKLISKIRRSPSFFGTSIYNLTDEALRYRIESLRDLGFEGQDLLFELLEEEEDFRDAETLVTQ